MGDYIETDACLQRMSKHNFELRSQGNKQHLGERGHSQNHDILHGVVFDRVVHVKRLNGAHLSTTRTNHTHLQLHICILWTLTFCDFIVQTGKMSLVKCHHSYHSIKFNQTLIICYFIVQIGKMPLEKCHHSFNHIQPKTVNRSLPKIK